MKDPRTIEGQWHIFGDDHAAPYGTLRVEPETGISLDVKVLRTSDVAAPQSAFGRFICPGTIHGFDSHGHPITLFACMTAQSSTPKGLDGLETYAIQPILGILGGHYSYWSEITAQTVRANYSLLDHWLGRSTIQAHTDSERATFTQQPLPDIAVRLPDDEEFVITCGFTQEHGIGELHLTQQHTVHFNFPRPRPLSRIRARYVHVFRQLLTLFTGSEVFIDAIEFSGRDFSKSELLSSNQGIASAQRKLSPGRVLVHYHEIAERFSEIAGRWFVYHSEMEPILNLYFSACWNSEMPGTTKFLLLAQALEAYHSRSPQCNSAVESTKAFRQRIDAILANVSEEKVRGWLREKLRHANQKTLAQRLNDLIGTHQQEVASFIPDPDSFAKTIRHTRNYFTHFDEDLRRRGKVAEVTQLAKIMIQMRGLLEICFLRDLGLPETAVKRVVARVRQVEFISLESSPSNS